MGDSQSHKEMGQRHPEHPKETERDLRPQVSASPLEPRNCAPVGVSHVCSLTPMLACDNSCGARICAWGLGQCQCAFPHDLTRGHLWGARLSCGLVRTSGWTQPLVEALAY